MSSIWYNLAHKRLCTSRFLVDPLKFSHGAQEGHPIATSPRCYVYLQNNTHTLHTYKNVQISAYSCYFQVFVRISWKRGRHALIWCVSIVRSKWHVWFASRCPGRRLSTWQMTAASCPTAALGALCDQLTFRRAWYREHSAVTATELLQPLSLAYGTPFRSSCTIQSSPKDCSDDSWRDTFLAVFCDIWYAAPYLLTYYTSVSVFLHRNSRQFCESLTPLSYWLKLV